MPLASGSPAPPGTPPGPVVLAFFKNSCPTCQLALPVVGELERRYGDVLPVIAVAQDPAAAATPWLAERGFDGELVDDADGYPLSSAHRLVTVPTLVLIDGDGTVDAVVEGWSREGYNALDTELARRAGRPSPGPVSPESDGRPPFKPG
ncbi:MAG: TlpA family protein disulfide reductase [Acidimicrobiales bacterium]